MENNGVEQLNRFWGVEIHKDIAFIFIAQRSTMVKGKLHPGQKQPHFTTFFSSFKHLHRQHPNAKLARSTESWQSWVNTNPIPAARLWTSTGKKEVMSSQAAFPSLHTQLWAAPVWAGSHHLVKPTEHHHLQRAEMRSWGRQSGNLSAVDEVEILSIKIMNTICGKHFTQAKSNAHWEQSDVLLLMQAKLSLHL